MAMQSDGNPIVAMIQGASTIHVRRFDGAQWVPLDAALGGFVLHPGQQQLLLFLRHRADSLVD